MKISRQQMFKTLACMAIILFLCAVAAILFISFFKTISFANPVFLYFIPVLLLALVFAGWMKRSFAPSIKYPVVENANVKFSWLDFIAKWLGFILSAAALCLCLIALARPRDAGQTVIPPTAGVDIMLTIDISGSMDAVDFQPNRIGAAKQTADDFINKRISDRIGVVVFADTAMLQAPLTLDYYALHDYVKMIRIGMLGGAGLTAIGDAIAVSVSHLKDSLAKSKIIILLTDGESNSGTVDPKAAAAAATSYGIKIYTVAIAGDGTAQIPVKTAFGTRYVNMPADEAGLGEALLMEIAKNTGGEFFRARNNVELKRIYDKIDELEKTDFKDFVEINYKDAYAPFLIAALLLFLASFIIDKLIFIKVP